MPKSSAKEEKEPEIENVMNIKKCEPEKYAAVVRSAAGTAKSMYGQEQQQQQQQQQIHNVAEKHKNKNVTSTAISVPTSSHPTYGAKADIAATTAPVLHSTAMRKLDEPFSSGSRGGYLTLVNKNSFKTANRSTLPTSNTSTSSSSNNNNNNNNNNTGYMNRGNKTQMTNPGMQQRTHKNYVTGCSIGGSSGINMATTNVATGSTSTSGQIQGGANSKKGRKNKRKDSQKKLKQIEMQNRSRSESNSSTNNNNYNSNKSNTLMNEKKYTILTSSNSATLLKNNNTNNNNTKTGITMTKITEGVGESVTPITTKTTQQTTDCNLSNHSSSHHSLGTCSSSGSDSTLIQKTTVKTTVTPSTSSSSKLNNNNINTNIADEALLTPLTVDTKSRQAKLNKISNNVSCSNMTSPANSDKQSDYAGPTTDTDSETLTADSPEGFMRSHEIMEQYLKPTSSLTFAKELDQEHQISFLNSSLSTCEEEDDSNDCQGRQNARFTNENLTAGKLSFGNFPEEEASNKQSSVSSSKSQYQSDTVENYSNDQNKGTMKKCTPSNCKKEDKRDVTIAPKVVKYTLHQLRELEKSAAARKPPMVDCKNRECISQLFVSRQHHHLSHKQLAVQYQHINYNESMEFLGKRRGTDGSSRVGLKKHHDHSSVSNNAGSRDSGLHQRKMDVIRVQLLLKEEIKLSECENAWQPDTLRHKASTRGSLAQIQDDLAAVLKKVRGVLNKLTPDNFDVLLKTMSSIIIDTQEKMHQVMLLVFEKTVSEPNFAPTYAKFCKILFQEIKGENRSNFNAALIKRIQHEFETNVNDADAKREKLQPLVDRMETCQETKERLELQAEIEERELQFRRRAWGTVRFIGEMYKLQSLTTDRVLLCLESLLQHGCEEKLEYMCKLLTTVGPLLEAAQTDNICRLDKIFRRTHDIINKTRHHKNQNKISSRVRFMMQDVIDLRGRNWDQQFTQVKGKNAARATHTDVSQNSPSNNNVDQHRSSYGSQQQQQRGRFPNKASGNMPHHLQHNSAQQHQENNSQKQNIDMTKLRFSSANDNTTLGNKSTYVWLTSNMRQNKNNSFNPGPITAAQNTSSVGNYSGQRSHKSMSKTRPIKSAGSSMTIADNRANSNIPESVKPEFRAKEFLNRLIEELLISDGNWQEELLQQWRNISREQQISLIRYLLSDYLHLSEVKRTQRQACSQMFMHLMRNCSQFDRCVFTEAYTQFGEDFPDLLVDVPNGWAYVFDFVGPIWQAGLLEFTDIWLSIWINEEHFTERFAKAMFDYYLGEFGKKYTRNLWQKVFAGEKPLAKGHMEHVSRWLDYGLQLIDKRCTNIAGTTLSEQQQKQQRLSITEQLKRIEYLLNATENSDLAEDYIATNVHITNSFLQNLTKFVCYEYAISTQLTDNNNAATSTDQKHLNQLLFKQKCVPLLRKCLRGYEIKDFGILDTIVNSLETMHDKNMANELVAKIFNALYECDMMSKEAFDNWYQTHVVGKQATDTEPSIEDDDDGTASSACDSLTEDLEATLTSVNVEFIAPVVKQQQAFVDAIGITAQTRSRRRRNKDSRRNQNKLHHGEVSRSASTSTANSPPHTPTPPTGDNTSKSLQTSRGSGQINEFMERLI